MRARHRLAVAGLVVLVVLWAGVGFAVDGVDGRGGYMIRLLALLSVALGTVWLVAAGFDVRYPGSPPVLVAVRLVGVTVVGSIALFITGDPWVFAGESGSAVSGGQQVAVAGLWLAALGAALVFQRRGLPVAAASGPPPPPTVGAAVPGLPAPAAGFRATVRRWPHLIAGVALVGPLLVVEGIVAVLGSCGLGGTAAVNLMALLVLTLPIGLPGIGVLRDRQLQRGLAAAAAHGGPAPSPGFAVAFGTMVLVAIVHRALLIGLVALAAAGADGPRQCFN